MRRRWKIGIAAAVLLCTIVAAIGLLASFTAREIERRRHDLFGLALSIQDYIINWPKAELILKGVKIYPAGRERKKYLLASADRMEVAIWPRLSDILKGELHIKKVTLVNPSIKYVRISRRRHNWDTLTLKKEESEKGAIKDGGWPLWIDTVKIKNGKARYRNRVQGHRMNLTEIDAIASNIVYEPRPHVLPTRIELRARLDQTKGRIFVKGRTNLSAKGYNFKIRGGMEKAPITYFYSFYRGQTPFRIRSGTMYVNSRATSKKSKLRSQHHATIYNLRAGGTKGKIVNALVLKRGGPVEIDATVNGDLDSGTFFVSHELSRSLSESILAQARVDRPVKKVGEKLKDAGTAVGRGIQKIFKRK